ncbi:MAG: thiamine pyrophosphate-dependent enzyme [Candidatus Bathyarchaeota archaeon]|nr:thiamine pyrophosphate-dependent enzyme [Candidatus Bathyarchaeota archaeon]
MNEQRIAEKSEQHPIEKWLRSERMPHMWCAGCGVGPTLYAWIRALDRVGIPREKVVYVSGIGCCGRGSGYLNVDGFHTTHGRAIPFAIGLKLAKPELCVSVISGDGDLFSIGGNHFIHACRRNVDLLVICTNNFIYGMTGGQLAPTTLLGDRATTAPYGNVEPSFSTPHLADAAGAVYVARWTSIHLRRLEKSIAEALQMKGFRYIEVLSPCPVNYGRRNKLPESDDIAEWFRQSSVIRNGADTSEIPIEKGKPLILGNFVKRAGKPTFYEVMKELEERVKPR